MSKTAAQLKTEVLALKRADKDAILEALLADCRAEDIAEEDAVTIEPILRSRGSGRFLVIEEPEIHIEERHQRILARLDENYA